MEGVDERVVPTAEFERHETSVRYCRQEIAERASSKGVADDLGHCLLQSTRMVCCSYRLCPSAMRSASCCQIPRVCAAPPPSSANPVILVVSPHDPAADKGQ